MYTNNKVSVTFFLNKREKHQHAIIVLVTETYWTATHIWKDKATYTNKTPPMKASVQIMHLPCVIRQSYCLETLIYRRRLKLDAYNFMQYISYRQLANCFSTFYLFRLEHSEGFPRTYCLEKAISRCRF